MINIDTKKYKSKNMKVQILQILEVVASIITCIVTIVGLWFAYKQIKLLKETNNMPLLKLVSYKQGVTDNKYIDYILDSDTSDTCITFEFENVGVGIARDIQIYSFNKSSYKKQFKTTSRLDIIEDLEIKSGEKNSLNMRFSSDVIDENGMANFIITYKNVYIDTYYGILFINCNVPKPICGYFNEYTSGYRSIINSFIKENAINEIKKIATKNKSANWSIP